MENDQSKKKKDDTKKAAASEEKQAEEKQAEEKAKQKKKRFQKDGEDAAYLFRGFHEGLLDPEDVKLFLKEHKDWVTRYGERNVKHNFDRTRDRYAKWRRLREGTKKVFYLSDCCVY